MSCILQAQLGTWQEFLGQHKDAAPALGAHRAQNDVDDHRNVSFALYGHVPGPSGIRPGL